MKRTIIALLTAVATIAIADEPKYLRPDSPGAGKICQPGQAMTYSMQCEPGSRLPVEEIWNHRPPGVSICAVRLMGCAPIAGQPVHARPGFEVQDTSPDELVVVTFGLERLLGIWPPTAAEVE